MTDDEGLNEFIENNPDRILTVEATEEEGDGSARYKVTAKGKESFVDDEGNEVNEDGSSKDTQEELEIKEAIE